MMQAPPAPKQKEHKKLVKMRKHPDGKFIGYIHFMPGKPKAYEVSVTNMRTGDKLSDQTLIECFSTQNDAETVLDGMYNVYNSVNSVSRLQFRAAPVRTESAPAAVADHKTKNGM